MTPLFACFPVCLTFVALAFVALLVMATGMLGPGADPDPPAAPVAEEPPDPATGPPSALVFVLIFAAFFLPFLLLLWLFPEL